MEKEEILRMLYGIVVRANVKDNVDDPALTKLLLALEDAITQVQFDKSVEKGKV